MIEPEIKIEVVSSPDPEDGAWEAAREVVADCFLHLLQERIGNTTGADNNGKGDGTG